MAQIYKGNYYYTAHHLRKISKLRVLFKYYIKAFIDKLA